MDMRKTGVGSAAWAKQDRTAFGANTPEGDEGAVGRTNFLCDVGLTYQRRYSSVLCAGAVTSSLGTMPALIVLLAYGVHATGGCHSSRGMVRPRMAEAHNSQEYLSQRMWDLNDHYHSFNVKGSSCGLPHTNYRVTPLVHGPTSMGVGVAV